jgi:hypothetical protein
MDARDKKVINERRKATGKSTGEQAAETGSQNIQQDLQAKAEQGGVLLADNFQAHMLVTALKTIQSGQYGAKTAAILDMMGSGTASPLDEWSNTLEAWTSQPALPSSASDSNG